VLLFAWLGVRARLERVTAAAWATAAVAGGLLFLACHGVMAWVEQRVSSGETALWMTAIPLWLVILDALRARRRPAFSVVIGLGLGAAGVAVLAAGDGLHPERARDHAALLACAFAWALGSLVARHGSRPASATQSTAMQLATGAVLVLAVSLASESWSGLRLTPRGTASLGFLIVCGTALGLAAYTWLLRVTSPAAVGTYAFVNPVIALLLGSAVGDDQLGLRTVLATTLVVSAVLVTQWGGLLGPRAGGSPLAEAADRGRWPKRRSAGRRAGPEGAAHPHGPELRNVIPVAHRVAPRVVRDGAGPPAGTGSPRPRGAP
jgi:drug/metabolite transporter (DMT)-like permease